MGNLELYHGRLGKDAQIRDTSAGELAELNLACEFMENEEKKTYWFKVKVWRPSAAIKALQKGDEVLVYGPEYKVETWTGRGGEEQETLVIVAVKVEVLPSRKGKSEPSTPATKPASRPSGGRSQSSDDGFNGW